MSVYPNKHFHVLCQSFWELRIEWKLAVKKFWMQEAMGSLLCASEIETHNKVLLVVIQSSSKPTEQQKPSADNDLKKRCLWFCVSLDILACLKVICSNPTFCWGKGSARFIQRNDLLVFLAIIICLTGQRAKISSCCQLRWPALA